MILIQNVLLNYVSVWKDFEKGQCCVRSLPLKAASDDGSIPTSRHRQSLTAMALNKGERIEEVEGNIDVYVVSIVRFASFLCLVIDQSLIFSVLVR